MKMMMFKNIECKYPIEIERREIYKTIYEYTVPEGYYFESYGQSYGNTIYASEVPDNHYIIRKKEEEDNG